MKSSVTASLEGICMNTTFLPSNSLDKARYEHTHPYIYRVPLKITSSHLRVRLWLSSRRKYSSSCLYTSYSLLYTIEDIFPFDNGRLHGIPSLLFAWLNLIEWGWFFLKVVISSIMNAVVIRMYICIVVLLKSNHLIYGYKIAGVRKVLLETGPGIKGRNWCSCWIGFCLWCRYCSLSIHPLTSRHTTRNSSSSSTRSSII